MIIEEPGFVTDRILFLGQKESCVYLLKGAKEFALIGGGMAHIVPDIEKQLLNFSIEEKKIKRLIILHSHFDHCGIVSYFKKQWPWISITASERAKELLGKPEVMESISSLNQMYLTEHGQVRHSRNVGIEVGKIDIDDVIKEGDILSCGDLSMEVIDVPGHSSWRSDFYSRQFKF
jgi:glyoxylase-like metal-dependent hydrolase (beta-lactamase superfamily II)